MLQNCSISPRIYGSICFNILLFIPSLIFTKINTDEWQDLFYYITLAFALIFNMNDSIFQGAFASLIGRFPEKYMSSLSQGLRWTVKNVPYYVPDLQVRQSGAHWCL